ncbi:GIY-YIG nuclease family protein [Chitinibacter bivalviorum]|uniref:GIY-YIG nuclease family protein n=2 Tax=Chitinibacter bivalviorum TaxID=2739434 RepID=A0A7H9BN19_9NEIS|nr:GIY-YIG nuclease family protein [Chitinibacter bivalviorum]
MQPWFVYILQCRDGSLYTGVAVDVAKRFAAHQAGKGAKYTRAHPPDSIALILPCANRSVAQKIEYAIKQLSTAEKRALLDGKNAALMPRFTIDSMGMWMEAI